MRINPGTFQKAINENEPPIRCGEMRVSCTGPPEIVVLDKEHSDPRGAKIMVTVDDMRQRDKPEIVGAHCSIHLYQEDVDTLRAAIAEFDKIPDEARL